MHKKEKGKRTVTRQRNSTQEDRGERGQSSTLVWREPEGYWKGKDTGWEKRLICLFGINE